jgi:DNA-directed RNA polymerase subunit RPC12/RpoP
MTNKCPRCGGEANATGKTWKFGKFDAKSFKCTECGKIFSGYYSEGKLSHTVPKA